VISTSRVIGATALFIASALYVIPRADDHPSQSFALVLGALVLVLAAAVFSQDRADHRRERDRQAHADQVAGWDLEDYIVGTHSEPEAAYHHEWRSVRSTWPEISAHAADISAQDGIGHAYVVRHHPDGTTTTWTWRGGAFVGQERAQHDPS
jgi:hypothetical protein